MLMTTEGTTVLDTYAIEYYAMELCCCYNTIWMMLVTMVVRKLLTYSEKCNVLLVSAVSLYFLLLQILNNVNELCD